MNKKMNEIIYCTCNFEDYESPDLISWSGSIITEGYDKDVYRVQGEVGYSYDKTNVSFDYCTDTNTIWINSRYRLVYSTNEELMKKCIMLRDEEGKCINLIARKALPYFRFPRSKDGIEIPILVMKIFKVFSDDTVKEKPHIMIPRELYYH